MDVLHAEQPHVEFVGPHPRILELAEELRRITEGMAELSDDGQAAMAAYIRAIAAPPLVRVSEASR